ALLDAIRRGDIPDALLGAGVIVVGMVDPTPAGKRLLRYMFRSSPEALQTFARALKNVDPQEARRLFDNLQNLSGDIQRNAADSVRNLVNRGADPSAVNRLLNNSEPHRSLWAAEALTPSGASQSLLGQVYDIDSDTIRLAGRGGGGKYFVATQGRLQVGFKVGGNREEFELLQQVSASGVTPEPILFDDFGDTRVLRMTHIEGRALSPAMVPDLSLDQRRALYADIEDSVNRVYDVGGFVPDSGNLENYVQRPDGQIFLIDFDPTAGYVSREEALENVRNTLEL
ncbi:MAG: hypothetical protein AAF772_16545, partial [Acidobacteriota bacterium]